MLEISAQHVLLDMYIYHFSYIIFFVLVMECDLTSLFGNMWNWNLLGYSELIMLELHRSLLPNLLPGGKYNYFVLLSKRDIVIVVF